MIAWSDICPVLIDVFTRISADPNRDRQRYSAEWKEGPRHAVHDAQRTSVLLKITSVVGLGEDEVRYSFDESTGALTTSVQGQRKFTVQVQVSTLERTDELFALSVTERIRTGLSLPSVADTLQAVEVSIIDVARAQKANWKDSGRVVSGAIVDCVFGTVAELTDEIPTSWIETIELTSHTKVGDVELQPSLQIVEEILPES